VGGADPGGQFRVAVVMGTRQKADLHGKMIERPGAIATTSRRQFIQRRASVKVSACHNENRM